jgi:excisionase family DNA binding protein
MAGSQHHLAHRRAAGVVSVKCRQYVSIGEAADYLKASPRTIRRMIADGDITGYRPSKRLIRVDLNEIEAAMKPFGGATWR